jgi:hypothetical protein
MGEWMAGAEILVESDVTIFSVESTELHEVTSAEKYEEGDSMLL